MDKSLKNKAINIKGKEYVEVSQRIIYFNENYEKGCIKTELLTDPESQKVVIKAFAYPDSDNEKRVFTGYAQEIWGEGYINKTSALENAETSAVGRALAMMGIGVIDSIASIDEITKAKNRANLPESNELYNKMMNELTERVIVNKSLKDRNEVTSDMIAEHLNEVAPLKTKKWKEPPTNEFLIRKILGKIRQEPF